MNGGVGLKKVFCAMAYLFLLLLLAAGILMSLAKNKAAEAVSSVLHRDRQA